VSQADPTPIASQAAARPVAQLPPEVDDWVARFRSAPITEPPAIAEVDRLVWNGVEQDASSVVVKLERDELHVTATYDRLGARTPNADEDTGILEVHLVDGSVIDSKECFVESLGGTISNALVRSEVSFTGFSWHRHRPGPTPRVWVARAHGVVGHVSPNLSAKGHPRAGLFLEGRYRYAVLMDCFKRAQACDVLTFTDGTAPDRVAVMDDFLALAFVLGTRIRVDHLMGVDEGGAVVEVLGGKIGEDAGHRFQPVPPAPMPLVPSEPTWVAPLFTEVSRALHEDRGLRVPLLYYVESGERIIDMECLDLHTALEALANRYLVKINKPEKFSSRRVKRAFDEFGFKLLLEQLKALRDRNSCAHEGLMNSDLKYDFKRDIRRVAVARTMLAALISLIAGYRGALRGWEPDTNGHTKPAPPSWWSIDAADTEAARTVWRSPPG